MGGSGLHPRLARAVASRRRGSAYSHAGWRVDPALVSKVFCFILALFIRLSHRLAVHCFCQRDIFALWTSVFGSATLLSAGCWLGRGDVALELSPGGLDLL